jgi:azurin
MTACITAIYEQDRMTPSEALGNAARASDRLVTTIVANDTLKFSVTRIAAVPGQTIHVELRNEGTGAKQIMGHNWVLLDDDSEATPYVMAALSAQDLGYMPKSFTAHVLAFIPLLGPKQAGEVTFTAPAKAGTYPFICSFPGHEMAGMRGELVVK